MTRPARRAAAHTALLIAVVGATAGAGAGVARADFTPDTLVSGSTSIESDYAAEPVISANGEYVAFVGSQQGVQGIWRKNLQTDELDFVAGGDASAPSISANGRYISFTTTSTDQVTGSGKQCPSVYVRDMSQPVVSDPEPPGAFILASVRNQSTASLSYAGSSNSSVCTGGGSGAAPRVALSADGNEVAFTVDGQSNLTTANSSLGTPPAQVAVRYLATDQTVLVSQTMSSIGSGPPQPVPGGGALTDGVVEDTAGAGNSYADPDSTAAISADGTTVAWQGIEVPTQAPAASSDAGSQPFSYSEPLWRQIADGPSAPIRRVTGGDDPVGCSGGCAGPLDTFWVNPQANNGGNNPTGPSAGTLYAPQGLPASTPFEGSPVTPLLDDATPQLSANGQTVAIVSTQPTAGADPDCSGINGCGSSFQTANVFVVNMAPGLSRSAALIRLTQWAVNDWDEPDLPLSAEINEVAISPEGERVAFVTQRTVFPFSPPALITPQLSEGPYGQLYVADLADGTLQAASIGYDGQPANGNVMEPSFSANNGPIAFASQATNLVFGAFSDVTKGYEAFTTSEIKPPAIPGVTQVSPPPPNPVIAPDWQISATAHRAARGGVLLSVSVPGAGRLSAAAVAGVPIGRLETSGAKAKHAPARASRGGVGRLVKVTLARAETGSGGLGVVEMRLVPAARYAPAIDAGRGLYATITIRFAVVGHPPLVETLPVEFTPAHHFARHGKTRRENGRAR